MSDYAKDYVEVSERIRQFYEKYPEGSLAMDEPQIVEVAGQTYILARAFAYRTHDDPRPGVGTAWEIVPGKTSFTRGSEPMNLETSCWGRAIAALGIATKRGIASAHEVRMAQQRNTTETIRTNGPIEDDPWVTKPIETWPLAYDHRRFESYTDDAKLSESQRKKVYAMALNELGLTKDQYAEFLTYAIDPSPESSWDLTAGEASALIDLINTGEYLAEGNHT